MTSREDESGIEGEVRVAGVGEAHQFKRGRVEGSEHGFVRCECLDTGTVVFADASRVVIAQKRVRPDARAAAGAANDRTVARRNDDEDEDDERPIDFYPTAVGWIAS